MIARYGVYRHMVKKGLCGIEKCTFPRWIIPPSCYKVSWDKNICDIICEVVIITITVVDERNEIIIYDIRKNFRMRPILLHITHRNKIEAFFTFRKGRANKVISLTYNCICVNSIVITSIRSQPRYFNRMYF